MIINYKRYRNNHCKKCDKYNDSKTEANKCIRDANTILKCAKGKLKEIFRSEFNADLEY